MDTITHALSGALLARATAARSPGPRELSVRARVIVGAGCAAFPDSDVVFTLLSPLTYLTLHRGITHSIVMLPLWTLVLAWIFARLARDARGIRPYLVPSALGLGIHILGDLITSFGTMILAPLSDRRFAWSTTFIIDLYLTGIIVAGLLLAALTRWPRLAARCACALVVGYIVLQAGLHARATRIGEDYAARMNLNRAQVVALPRPVSPFNWSVFVLHDDRYHSAHINLARAERKTPAESFIARLDAAYLPVAQAQWEVIDQYGRDEDSARLARAAWQQDEFAFYRWFAALPALYRVDRGNPDLCIWYHDLRFWIPGRDTTLFRYGLCRPEPGGTWNLRWLDGSGRRVELR